MPMKLIIFSLKGNFYSSLENAVTVFRSSIGIPEAENVNSVLFGGMCLLTKLYILHLIANKSMLFFLVIQNIYKKFMCDCTDII